MDVNGAGHPDSSQQQSNKTHQAQKSGNVLHGAAQTGLLFFYRGASQPLLSQTGLFPFKKFFYVRPRIEFEVVSIADPSPPTGQDPFDPDKRGEYRPGE